MIGTQPIGALGSVIISAVSHEGLSVTVDGKPARLAIITDDGRVIAAGDQVVFDGQHRFVLEFPAAQVLAAPTLESESTPMEASDNDPAKASPATRLPWLLLAALLLGLVLAALLWFGAR